MEESAGREGMNLVGGTVWRGRGKRLVLPSKRGLSWASDEGQRDLGITVHHGVEEEE